MKRSIPATVSPARATVTPHVRHAFKDTVHAVDVAHLASLMGCSVHVLYNKANTEDLHHKPTLDDAVMVQALTGDKRITQAMAATLGGVFVDLSGLDRVSDDALLELVADWMREQGEFFCVMQASLADGQVSAVELAKLRAEGQDVLRAVLTLVERLAGMQR